METPGRNRPWVQFYKCVTMGDEAVGKSCLLLRFMGKKFRPELDATVGIDADQRIISIDDKPTKFQIWDPAGEESRRFCTSRGLYRGAAAAILVYDITRVLLVCCLTNPSNRRETFDHIGRWLKEAEELAPPNLTTILVGNKCDLSHERAVSYEEGQEFAEKHGLIFMESSAKNNQNVEEVTVRSSLETKRPHHLVMQAFFTAARTVSKKSEDGVLHPSAEVGLFITTRTPY
ncbi:hypothetical protein EJB05_28062 [Eragrostis curvula]|uniref:Uncharacterized protein n=1 Tax=Eragrostis curvula TaxID=38414 RepID=A0A5J9UQK9_9POAL|nr:hypothetical protein EJB05_28062 [Eragrostis curvula]